MLRTRLDDRDFGPLFPAFRLALACAAFGALGYLFALETRNAYAYGAPVTNAFLVERAGIAAFMLLVFTLLVAHLLLPLRLRFGEAGILRRTVFRPRFIPWQGVTAASLTSFRAAVSLELRVTGRRLPVLIPLSEYRRPAALLAELRRRLPVEVQGADTKLAARLKDE